MLYTQAMGSDEMTLKDAMKFLGIKSRITMRKYANEGVIPSHRATMPWGATWRVFKRSDLAAFKAKMNKHPDAGMGYIPIGSKKKRPK